MTTIAHSMSALRPVAADGAGPADCAGAAGDGVTGCGGAAAAFAGAAAGAAAACFGAGASAAPSASTMATTLPSDNLSPSFTFSSTILPATDDGTSIVALSDSSVTRPWSCFTTSPTATSNSITGTSS